MPFAGAVTRVMESLAEQIAADGEGARKLIVIRTGYSKRTKMPGRSRAYRQFCPREDCDRGQRSELGPDSWCGGVLRGWFDPRGSLCCLQDVRVCRGGLAVDMDEERESQARCNRVTIDLRV